MNRTHPGGPPTLLQSLGRGIALSFLSYHNCEHMLIINLAAIWGVSYLRGPVARQILRSADVAADF